MPPLAIPIPSTIRERRALHHQPTTPPIPADMIGGGIVPVMFKTNDLVILAVSSVVAVGLLYFLFDYTLVVAIAWTAFFAVIGLVGMYFRGKRSS
jgi:hypothetical protein